MPSPLVKPLPSSLMVDGDFASSVEPTDLVLFLLNVGDGDAQLVVLPVDAKTGRRQVVVIDVASFSKMDKTLSALKSTPLLSDALRAEREFLAVVIGTHPHADHIAGMASFLDKHHDEIGEYWDSGYYHTSAAYENTMRVLEDRGITMVQPTSGVMRFVGQVKLTVLTPGISLRNRYDTYGIEINNSSISVKLEVPASRVVERGPDRSLVRGRAQSMILGADTQTVSWAQAVTDFPELHPDESPVAKIMGQAQGHYPLKADVFKVPHHGSKHGLNLELVEAMDPKLSLISSVSGAGKYNFPHLLCLEALREAKNPIASQAEGEHDPDHELGIHLTGAEDDAGDELGSMALVVSSTSNQRTLWRFYDGPKQQVDLSKGRRLDPTP